MIKQVVQRVAWLITAPLALTYRVIAIKGNPDSAFHTFSQLLSLIPGKTGSYLRVGFYRHTLAHCDPDCFIAFGTLFSHAGTEIHQGVYIGPNCNIGLSIIREDSLLGSGVHIMSGRRQHNFSDPSVPAREQGGQFEQVEIGADCWLGNGALILATVAIKSVVGAGAVVTKPIPAGSIVSGNPAIKIGSRPVADGTGTTTTNPGTR